MPLLKIESVSLAFGHKALLDGVDLEVDKGERVCLVGRNGEGKSSLMRVIAGEVMPDDGEVRVLPPHTVGYLPQDTDFDSDSTVFDLVAGGLHDLGRLISDYHQAALRLGQTGSERDLQQLSDLQHELEAAGGWQIEQQVETVLSRLSLDGEAAFNTLSGGWRRRVMLARALVSSPDVLMLDEPTNHLDIAAITWLEDFMADYPGALLFISHDRAFVRRLATRVIELDRGALSSWPGGYDDYVRRKAEQLEIEARQNAEFDKKLSKEEQWIRQGIKARRTRNEGRVRALKQMREQRKLRRERSGRVSLALDEGELSGKRVCEAIDVSLSFGDKAILKDFSTTILRGDRVGIIGPNGVGKSTLIKVLLDELKPDAGKVLMGTKLQVAYFDQQRAILDPEKSVMDNINPGSQRVTVGGRNRHVAGYLKDFLFPPERLQSPVRTLSGGERNRLLLARLFTQPANLLVMDEPTNDLDVETLELLEELLVEYDGTLIIVSHDRAFLDNVVTSTLVFEDDGRVGEYVGGYNDWLQQRPAEPVKKEKPAATGKKEKPCGTGEGGKPKKLSYKDQRELDALPQKIETLEAEQAALQEETSDPAFYQQSQDEVTKTLGRLEAVTAELEACYVRWEMLES